MEGCEDSGLAEVGRRVSLPVVLHADAEKEVEEAARWYEQERSGLGLEFIAAVGRIVEEISGDPERFVTWRAPWRRVELSASIL